MSAVNITNVTILDNPARFLSPFQFEISYECLVPLKDDLEWKLIYVGSAEDETYDLNSWKVYLKDLSMGVTVDLFSRLIYHTFTVDSGCLRHFPCIFTSDVLRTSYQADPPDPSKIREEDIIGVTVLLLTCSYLGQEFVRVGYYVNSDYDDEQLREEPPQKVLIDKVQRNILADKPRVTKFPINFHPESKEHEKQPAHCTITSPSFRKQ